MCVFYTFSTLHHMTNSFSQVIEVANKRKKDLQELARRIIVVMAEGEDKSDSPAESASNDVNNKVDASVAK